MRKAFVLVACLCLPLGANVGRAADWPQFRGPGGGSVSDEKDLPVKWSTTENVRWKADLPGRGVSNPVIASGRVYVTATSGYRESRLHVLCFDEATGKKLWERQFASTGNTACHPKTCMAAPTPATDGQNVYALFATGDLAALDADGTLLWYRSLASDYPNLTNQVGMAASPVLNKDLLFLPMENAGDSFVAALDKATGKNRWKVPRPRSINWVTPLLVSAGGRTDVLFQSAKELTAYDPDTGKVRWSFKEEAPSSIPMPAAGDGLLFVPGEEGGLFALKQKSAGAAPEMVWRSSEIAAGFASPVYFKGRVYGLSRIGVNCLDAADGKQLWLQRIKGPIAASPVVADGKLYVVNEAGTTFVLQLGDAPKILASNALNETILATPAIANGAIYLRSDEHLYCIGAAKGK
jgi:outer membrane protein assembly factor BamB